MQYDGTGTVHKTAYLHFELRPGLHLFSGLTCASQIALSNSQGNTVADKTITSAFVGRVMLCTVLAEFNGKR